jgi:ATP-dependent Lon protease
MLSVPEQGGGKLIPEGMSNPGQIYTVSRGKTGMVGVYRLETQCFRATANLNAQAWERIERSRKPRTLFQLLEGKRNTISGSISTTTKDYIINYQDLNGIGMSSTWRCLRSLRYALLRLAADVKQSCGYSAKSASAETILKVEELANVLQVCLDSGAKKVLLPITSAAELGSVPSAW